MYVVLYYYNKGSATGRKGTPAHAGAAGILRDIKLLYPLTFLGRSYP